MIRRLAISLGLAGFFALTAQIAQAQMQVFGNGWARDCYVMVKEGRVPLSKMIDTCSVALEQEQLSRERRVATLVNRGIAHMRMEHESAALADFDAGIATSPDIPEIWINRGAVMYRLGRYQEALENLNRGIKVTRIDALAALHFNRGITQEKLGNLEAAYADLKRAVELDPLLEQAKKRLARYQVVGSS